ncbi:hypothetical protein V2I01_39250 [Micromonospora sp. BRA006-A]|nr:hypothetical protein [Micromonospora sp. BRA006-A]
MASNSLWNVGSATLTTVTSRIDMIAPSTTTPATLSTAASSFVDVATGCWVTDGLLDPVRHWVSAAAPRAVCGARAERAAGGVRATA